jgi:hypothetical protein
MVGVSWRGGRQVKDKRRPRVKREDHRLASMAGSGVTGEKRRL